MPYYGAEEGKKLADMMIEHGKRTRKAARAALAKARGGDDAKVD